MDFTPEQVPDTLTIEHDGHQIPLRDHPIVKGPKDMASFVKMAVDAHREVGARQDRIPASVRPEEIETYRQRMIDAGVFPKAWAPVPGKDARPEEIAAFKQRAYEAGVFTPPPSTVDEYRKVIAKPEGVSELAWSDERAGRLAETLHKHGIPASAVPDLLALHAETLGAVQGVVKSDMESGMAALRREFPEDFEAKQVSAGRLAAAIFKTPEELAAWTASGLGNHPAFLGPLMRLAPLAEQDSSFFAETSKSGAASGVDVRSEVAKIATDTTHPMHAGYTRRDPKVMQYIDELYRKAYGSDPVEIGQGITVTGAPA